MQPKINFPNGSRPGDTQRDRRDFHKRMQDAAADTSSVGGRSIGEPWSSWDLKPPVIDFLAVVARIPGCKRPLPFRLALAIRPTRAWAWRGCRSLPRRKSRERSPPSPVEGQIRVVRFVRPRFLREEDDRAFRTSRRLAAAEWNTPAISISQKVYRCTELWHLTGTRQENGVACTHLPSGSFVSYERDLDLSGDCGGEWSGTGDSVRRSTLIFHRYIRNSVINSCESPRGWYIFMCPLLEASYILYEYLTCIARNILGY